MPSYAPLAPRQAAKLANEVHGQSIVTAVAQAEGLPRQAVRGTRVAIVLRTRTVNWGDLRSLECTGIGEMLHTPCVLQR
jgi:hypothetical protein